MQTVLGLIEDQAARAFDRAVADLACERRLVRREAHPGDGRGVRLTLTGAGRRTYGALIRAAVERDAAFRGCLSKAEHQVFDRALAKLDRRAFMKVSAAAAGIVAAKGLVTPHSFLPVPVAPSRTMSF